MAKDIFIELDPKEIYFTHSRIHYVFSCGRRLEETINGIKKGTIAITDLPTITVWFDGTHYYSRNNRRLFVFKKLRGCAFLNTIKVRVKKMPETKRMKGKYTPETCVVEARYKSRSDHHNACSQ